jgi:hypothetical protein
MADLIKRKQFKAVSEDCRKRLIARGFLDLGCGSVIRWMEEDWFARAKKMRAIESFVHTLKVYTQETYTEKHMTITGEEILVEKKRTVYKDEIVTDWLPVFPAFEEFFAMYKSHQRNVSEARKTMTADEVDSFQLKLMQDAIDI